MRFVVVEHIGPVPAPRIGLPGAGAFHPPAAIDLKASDQGPDVVSNMFLPLPNNQENPFGPALIPARPKHHGCGKMKNIVMAKMDDFSKFFRKLFGFSPIEEFDLRHFAAERHGEHPVHKMMAAHVAGPDDDNDKFHILPFMPGPVRVEGFPPPGSDDVSALPHSHSLPTAVPARQKREGVIENAPRHVAVVQRPISLTLFSFPSFSYQFTALPCMPHFPDGRPVALCCVPKLAI